ncbi:MAG: deoxyhypusine synthase [Methanocellales archaeon]|nr:deoxyhypusine synthase [Methanocellales archaeon]
MSELRRPIKQMRIKDGMTAGELIEEMSDAAFGAGRLAEAVDIYEEMLRNDTTKFFGLAGAMVPAGMRLIVKDLIEDGYIDVLVTTGANLVHDLIEVWGGYHYRGTSCADDIELHHQQINRIFDVFLPEDHFTAFEKKLLDLFVELNKKDMSIRELLMEIGRRVDADSIMGVAARKDVPIFCPAIADSAIGLQAWLHTQTQKLNVDTFKDMHEFMDICYKAKKTGAVFIGGGVPKNFILQSMIVTPKGGFDYAIQLTMDRPETGGLSGATLDEAKSWGKVGAGARAVTVYADATITLPILVAAVRERLERK